MPPLIWHSWALEATDPPSGGKLCVHAHAHILTESCPDICVDQGRAWLVTAPFQASPDGAGRHLQPSLPLGNAHSKGACGCPYFPFCVDRKEGSFGSRCV